MSNQLSKTAFPIALIFSIRMLGLFMLIPVFTIYADEFSQATPRLIGLALGIYGLTQAIFQIPLGTLSDKIGRKKVIACGLLLFSAGSLIAAFSQSITMLIFARALQGTGAVGSTLIALTADLTRDEDRTKAMAVIGLSIGVSFSIAMVISPPLAKLIHLRGIFSLMSALGVLGLIVLFYLVPTPKKEVFHTDSEPVPQLFSKVLKDSQLLRLDLGIFCQHAMLTSTFFAIPMLLETQVTRQWLFYLPIMALSFVLMIPLIIIAEKKFKMKLIFCFAILTSCLSQLLLAFYFNNFYILATLLCLYFIGFNVLEASLPSLVSKTARISAKGTAMGIYSTSQFLGIFIGGLMAGALYHHYQFKGIFFFNGLTAAMWYLLAITMKRPAYLTTKSITLDPMTDNSAIFNLIEKQDGIIDSYFAANENTLYFKIDRRLCNWEQVKQLIKSSEHQTSQ